MGTIARQTPKKGIFLKNELPIWKNASADPDPTHAISVAAGPVIKKKIYFEFYLNFIFQKNYLPIF